MKTRYRSTSLCAILLLSAVTPMVDLTTLPSNPPLQGERVQVRGFWYPQTPTEGILSPDLGLKSCCLATPSTLQQRLFVKGEVSAIPSERAVTIEGILKVHPLYNEEGVLTQYYVLEEALLITRESSGIRCDLLGIALFLVSAWIFFVKGVKVFFH